jgi:hypothetical protein
MHQPSPGLVFLLSSFSKNFRLCLVEDVIIREAIAVEQAAEQASVDKRSRVSHWS